MRFIFFLIAVSAIVWFVVSIIGGIVAGKKIDEFTDSPSELGFTDNMEDIKQEGRSFCPGCGKQLAPGSRFCSGCGKKIE